MFFGVSKEDAMSCLALNASVLDELPPRELHDSSIKSGLLAFIGETHSLEDAHCAIKNKKFLESPIAHILYTSKHIYAKSTPMPFL